MAGVQRAGEFNRRTLDGLAARLYFYYSLAHEHTGSLSDIRRCAARPPGQPGQCSPHFRICTQCTHMSLFSAFAL